MTAEELLMMSDDVETYIADDALVIDPESRTILTPVNGLLLGVESDEEAERIKFVCPRIVGDNIDLSTLQLRAIYRNANGDKDFRICTDITIDGENIRFSWSLSRKVTRYKGMVNFIICAIRTQLDGSIKNEWNTTLAEGKVLEGLEVDISEEEFEEPKDIVLQLLGMLDEKATEIMKEIDKYLEKLKIDNNLDVNSENAIQNKVVTKEMNRLSEEIGDVKSDLDKLNEGGLVIKDEVIAEDINNWLDEHPEATTTVKDHSLTIDKMVVGTLGYVTPEMFGAVGDGATDDTEAMQNALDNGNVILSIGKIYLISKTLTMTVCGSSLTSFKNNSRFGYIKSSSEFNGKSIIEITAPQCTIQGITFFGNNSLISITSKLVKTNESSYYLSDNDVTIIGNRFVNNKCISHYGRGLHCENNIFENPTDNAIDIYGTEDSESTIMQLMTQYGGRAIKILNNRMHAPTGSKYLVHFHNDVSCQWYGVVIKGNLMDLSGSLIRSDCKLINTLICENSVNMNYWQTADIYLSDCESVNINNNILCGREKEYTSGYLHNNSIFIGGKFINSEIANNVIANTGDAPIRSKSDIINSIISNNKVRYASIINSQFLVYSDGTITNSFIDKNIIDDNSKCLKVVNCNTISNLWLGKNYGIEHLIPFDATSGTYTDVEYISSTGVLTVANS